MPDIGTTLREARMRARIDISEIEAETKIRAKYLRALENEEWDLLPGPTYVKSFLRTYADALGLDGKLLIEEYKLRHERLSDVELQPIAPLGQRERRRRPRAAVPRGWIVAVVVVGLLAGLWVIGNRNSDDSASQSSTPPPSTSRPPTATSSKKAATPAKKKKQKKKKAKAKAKHARLTIVATGQVYVCLKAAGKRTPVPGIVLTGGARQGPYNSSRFRLQLGTSEARLVVNGRSHNVPSVANGIGYEITPRRIRRLPSAQWPRCPTA
ncbi:MAG TPA: helix-turn-helix domain-containing protein [Solirubrobacteraceae bacterium]|nr:helix-turn-helix domain-containing protein [Solirubrobacteraceae bacterium]